MAPPDDLSYILNELSEDRENYFNAVSPPIMQTSNFAFRKVEDLQKAFEDEMGGYLYSRGLNPTVEILRKKLAALDGAEDCLVFYSWAQRMFDVVLPRFGVTTTYIDGTRIDNWQNATQTNTTFFYLESPNSWD